MFVLFFTDKTSLTKSKLNLLHILVRNNVIPKLKGPQLEDPVLLQKKLEVKFSIEFMA